MATINDATSEALTDQFGQPLLDETVEPRPASADYADAELAHLPIGRAWARDGGSVLSNLLAAFAPTFSNLAERALYSLRESPAGDDLLEMLPEWEETLSLPDPCSGPDATIELRQMHVRARLTQLGGQSVPYFTAYAAALGYTITVEEFAPARYGRRNYGLPRYGADWAYVWRVHAPSTTTTPAQYGSHRSGEPYTAWQSNSLVCELNRIKPAHTALLFAYG